MDKSLLSTFFKPGVMEKFAYMSRGRRKEWKQGWASRKKRRHGLGKVAHRKAIRLMGQRHGDWVREKLNEDSFARRVLPVTPVESANV